MGMIIGFPTILIPALTAKNSQDVLHLTMEQASWCGSVGCIFQPLGSIIAGLALQPLGCKKSMMLLNIPLIACWLIVHFATSNYALYFANGLFGCVMGLTTAPGLRYVIEISEPSLRGILVASTSLFISLGFSFIIFLNSLTDWRQTAAISASIPLLCIIILFQVPETPMWLVSKGRSDAALKSLRWLRGWTDAETVREEYEKIVSFTKNQNQKLLKRQWSGKVAEYKNCPTVEEAELAEPASASQGLSERVRKMFKDMTRKEMLIPLTKCCIIFAINCFSGVPILRTYMVKIFDDLNLPVDPKKASVWVALMGMLGNIGCMFVIKKLKKKPLFLASLAGSALCLFSMAADLMGYLEGTVIASFHRWCHLTFAMALYFFWNLGIQPIAWSYLGEILPYKGRGPATSVASSFYFILTFVGIRTFPAMTEFLRLEGVLLFYAVVCVAGLFFTHFLPETEGRHLSDIQAQDKEGAETEKL
nr:PREDICTED: facilitated trehalose transporter Tret1-like isoform X1 [Bemisia tabaci]